MQYQKLRALRYNKHGQLRAVWRMIIYVILGVLAFLPLIPLFKIIDWIFPLQTDDTGIASSANLLFLFLLNISFLMAAWITLKWIDHRPPALLGLNFWLVSLKELLIGIGIGLANFGVVFLFLAICGWISVGWADIGPGDAASFLLYFITFFVFAAFEELINRGYLFQTFCEGAGIWVAAITMNLIFSLVHVFNPAFSILAGVFLFLHGLVYAVAYLKTRSLWTPIGLHLAWNFAQEPIAGMKVSGTTVDSSLLVTETGGPELMTGGSFGVEGGLVAIVAAAVLLLMMVKGSWLKPSGHFLRVEREWGEKREQVDSSAQG